MNYSSGLVYLYAVGKTSDQRYCSKNWHIYPQIEVLWSERDTLDY